MPSDSSYSDQGRQAKTAESMEHKSENGPSSQELELKVKIINKETFESENITVSDKKRPLPPV